MLQKIKSLTVEINDGEATNGKDEINPGFLQRSETCIK
jgi:hypothetical protein